MTEYHKILKRNLESLRKAHSWLQASYQKCSSIELGKDISLDDLDALEALSSRFSRVIDLTLQKVFRSIEEIELSAGGTLLDVIHRFQKRGFDLDENRLREMRELRNRIAHEYIEELLGELFRELMLATEYLDGIVAKTLEYAEKLLDNMGKDDE